VVVKSGQNEIAKYSYRYRTNGLSPWGPTLTARIFDSYSMVSTNHPGWRQNTSGDSGGYFLLTKTTARHSLGTLKSGVFEGQFACGDPAGFTQPFTSYATPTDSALNAKGSTAIARTEPTRSVSDVATFIGELRTEGLPRLNPSVLKASTKKAKAAGSDYLNVEFGWKPVVNDLQKFFTAVTDAHSILENYHKHGNNQKIRRRYAFPSQTETSATNAVNFLPIPSQVNAFGQGTILTRRQQDMWFSGAFRYYIPVPVTTADKIRGYASDVQKLSGVALTPEVVWNLQPWSWLVDWQSNVGDVLHNISSMGRDGLVLQYGYMMVRSEHETSRCARFGAGSYASNTVTSSTKKRIPATPYGFGVDLAALTSRQTAILVALGLSRT